MAKPKSSIGLAKTFAKEAANYYSRELFEAAQRHYTYAIHSYDYNPVYYYNRARCYFHQSKFAECIEDCTQSINLDSTCVKVNYVRMLAYQEMLDFDGDLDTAMASIAIEDCEIVLQKEPENAKVKSILTSLQARLNKFTTAAATTTTTEREDSTSTDEGKTDYEHIDFITKV